MFLFFQVIGRKSGEYQAGVLIFFGQAAQPCLNRATDERGQTRKPAMPTRIHTLIAATLIAFSLPAAPAHADDGIWKVGNGYVIRFEKLDLSRAMDRQALLAQVERAAEKLCRGERPALAREACKAETVRSMKDSAGPSLRATLDVARFERDGVQQAQR